MRRLPPPLIALALAVVFPARGAGAAAPERPPLLLLTAEVVARSYCAGDQLDNLRLRLRLRYRNAGGAKLILYAGKNLFYQTKIRRAAGAGAGPPYEVTVLNARYNDAEAEAVDGPSPGKAFVVLSPGQSYETEIAAGAAVEAGDARAGGGTLVAGEHTLHVVASTWYESKKLADELRRRWRRKGFLWAEPVASEPLRLPIERARPAERCR